jgi:2-polyprenyl-3-methyl-5-hydroxy-6-metoxy-1,4-benzoquinol methylase
LDPDYGRSYRDLHERHWWWRARKKVVAAELDRLVPTGGWSAVLDVGCGDGLLFEHLARYAERVDGVEPDEGLVSERLKGTGSIHLGPFNATFRPGRRYGLMLFLDVLEHMEDPDAALRHASSLLEEGGVVLVTVPAFRHLWTTHDVLNHHVTRYNRREITDLLARHFTVERARYFFRWIYPAKLALRVVEAVRQPAPSSPSVPPTPVNRSLYGLSRVEEALMGRMPVPWGSSVLAVARGR